MANPIFDAMNNNQNNQSQLDIVRQFGAFRQDPFEFMLQRKGINIPKEYRNDPHGAVQYLLNSGQMTDEQLTYLKNVAWRMGIPIN